MDEDFKDVTTNSHHVAIIFFLVIIAILIGGYFLVFKPRHFSLKTMEVELGVDIPESVEDYLNTYGGELKDYTLNISKVDKDTIGEYTYTVSNGKITKNGTLKIVDTTAPKFTLKEMVIEEGNEEYYLGDFLSTCDDASKPCLVSLKNSKDESKFKELGTHEIDIEVADVYGNKKGAKATLKVVEKGNYVDPRSQDLEYASSSKKDGEFKGTIYKKLESAINPQSDAARDEMSTISTIDLNTYVQENHPGYAIVSTEIIELYNKDNWIIGYSIELVISNGKEITVYVDKAKVKSDDSTVE